MEILLISQIYPKENELYNGGFIHRRVINYQLKASDVKIKVFVLDEQSSQAKSYIFEDVSVIRGNKKELINYIKNNSIDKILIHFINKDMMEVLRFFNYRFPTIIWVHGFEALGWYRRLFNFNFKDFPKYAIKNMIQMKHLRKFIKEIFEKDVKFVFVSNWMKRILEFDTFSKVHNCEIIPNIVDDNIFKYTPKNTNMRKKILLIRPFESRKYANDIAIKAIIELSSKPFFQEIEFTIYGKGKDFERLTGQVSHFSNVHIFNEYLTQSQIAHVHKEHGVFLCPTRQDAQGVSMCEAMSSGLVPITSNNTAIPEFVKHNKTGYLTNNHTEIAKWIEHLFFNSSDFHRLSQETAISIKKQCNSDLIINKEMQLISE